MRSTLTVAVLVIIAYVWSTTSAKPSISYRSGVRRSVTDHYIIGGENALPGAWPWQLSFQYNGASGYSHFCGAVLLRATGAISAAHCVDEMPVNVLRIVAGLHDRRDLTGAEIRPLTSYTMHERYDPDEITYDIATLVFSPAIADNGFTIGYGKLPENNNNDFSNTVCVLTGWGRTNHSPTGALPNILQQVNMGILTTSECNMVLSPLDGIIVDSTQICSFDSQEQRGSCNGDSGGPMNCPTSAGYVVAGITSWGISSEDYRCYTEFPSVYTRTSHFLPWILSKLP